MFSTLVSFQVDILTCVCFVRLHHAHADVLVSSLETVVTFTIAYPAAVALGKVLLQTAPERGFPVGQTEAFLKVMRDVSSPSREIKYPHLINFILNVRFNLT